MEAKQKKQFTTVDGYLALQPEKVRAMLEKLRQVIKKAAPGAEEVISYQMPAFKFHGMLVWYAAFKNQYGLYPLPKTLEVFKDKLAPYELSKGTVRFPFNKPVPVKLVTEIIKYRVKENTEKALLKSAAAAKKVEK